VSLLFMSRLVVTKEAPEEKAEPVAEAV